jgi:hypothetical protein
MLVLIMLKGQAFLKTPDIMQEHTQRVSSRSLHQDETSGQSNFTMICKCTCNIAGQPVVSPQFVAAHLYKIVKKCKMSPNRRVTLAMG